MRTVEEIAKRAMCICAAAAKGEGTDQEVVIKIIQRYDLANHFTPNEKSFLNDANVCEQDRVQFAWKHECYWVLLWVMGYVEELSYPDITCDVHFAVTQLSEQTRES